VREREEKRESTKYSSMRTWIVGHSNSQSGISGSIFNNKTERENNT